MQLLSVLVIAGCATARNAGVTPVEERGADENRREVYRGSSQTELVDYHPTPNRARVIDLPGSAETLWPRVIAAYDAVGLPLGEVDVKGRTLGTSAMRVSARVGGTSLGDYIDCGGGPLGTRAADTYLVTMRVVTELRPSTDNRPDATLLRTLVTATGKANGTQGDPVSCVSTGQLETKIARAVAPSPTASK